MKAEGNALHIYSSWSIIFPSWLFYLKIFFFLPPLHISTSFSLLFHPISFNRCIIAVNINLRKENHCKFVFFFFFLVEFIYIYIYTIDAIPLCDDTVAIVRQTSRQRWFCNWARWFGMLKDSRELLWDAEQKNNKYESKSAELQRKIDYGTGRL